MNDDWHHAPPHRFGDDGAYMVTAGTYRKRHILSAPEKLSLVRDRLRELAPEYGWDLRAWAVLSNHYHFVALPPEEPGSLSDMVRHLHSDTARQLNRMDDRGGRRDRLSVVFSRTLPDGLFAGRARPGGGREN